MPPLRIGSQPRRTIKGTVKVGMTPQRPSSTPTAGRPPTPHRRPLHEWEQTRDSSEEEEEDEEEDDEEESDMDTGESDSDRGREGDVWLHDGTPPATADSLSSIAASYEEEEDGEGADLNADAMMAWAFETEQNDMAGAIAQAVAEGDVGMLEAIKVAFGSERAAAAAARRQEERWMEEHWARQHKGAAGTAGAGGSDGDDEGEEEEEDDEQVVVKRSRGGTPPVVYSSGRGAHPTVVGDEQEEEEGAVAAGRHWKRLRKAEGTGSDMHDFDEAFPEKNPHFHFPKRGRGGQEEREEEWRQLRTEKRRRECHAAMLRKWGLEEHRGKQGMPPPGRHPHGRRGIGWAYMDKARSRSHADMVRARGVRYRHQQQRQQLPWSERDRAHGDSDEDEDDKGRDHAPGHYGPAQHQPQQQRRRPRGRSRGPYGGGGHGQGDRSPSPPPPFLHRAAAAGAVGALKRALALAMKDLVAAEAEYAKPESKRDGGGKGPMVYQRGRAPPLPSVVVEGEQRAAVEARVLNGLRAGSEGRLALHVAAEAGQASAVSLLMSLGARADVTDQHGGLLPLHLAARHGHRSIHAMEALLCLPFSDPKDDAAPSPSHPQRRRPRRFEPAVPPSPYFGRPAQTATGATPLHIAALQKQPAAVRLLLRHHRAQWSAVQEGLKQQAAAAVEIGAGAVPPALREEEAAAAQQWMAALVDAPMDGAGAGAYRGWRPLHAAVVGGSRACVEVLLAEGGADPHLGPAVTPGFWTTPATTTTTTTTTMELSPATTTPQEEKADDDEEEEEEGEWEDPFIVMRDALQPEDRALFEEEARVQGLRVLGAFAGMDAGDVEEEGDEKEEDGEEPEQSQEAAKAAAARPTADEEARAATAVTPRVLAIRMKRDPAIIRLLKEAERDPTRTRSLPHFPAAANAEMAAAETAAAPSADADADADADAASIAAAATHELVETVVGLGLGLGLGGMQLVVQEQLDV